MIIRNSPTWLIFHSQIERYRRKDKNVHYEIISKVGSMLIGPNPDDWNWPEANTVVWIIQHFSRFPGVITLSISHRHVSIISTSKLICSMTFSNLVSCADDVRLQPECNPLECHRHIFIIRRMIARAHVHCFSPPRLPAPAVSVTHKDCSHNWQFMKWELNFTADLRVLYR